MIELNLIDEAKYLVDEVGCTNEEAIEYVELEDRYYDKIGLNVYEPTDDTDSDSDIVVEEDEMNEFILKHSNLLTKKLVEKMNEAELKYFKLVGLVQ